MTYLNSLFHMRRKSDAQATAKTPVADSTTEDAVRKLAMLTLQPRTPPRQPQGERNDFVGGFHPAAVGSNIPVNPTCAGRSAPSFPVATSPPHPGPPPVPPKLPDMTVTPPQGGRTMSKTLEYAMSSPNGSESSTLYGDRLQRPSVDSPSRPRSDPAAYTRPVNSNLGPPLTPQPPRRQAVDDRPSISVPPKPSSRTPLSALQISSVGPRGRSVSSPVTPSAGPLKHPNKITCSGYTKAGVRCTRQKDRSALSLDDPDSVWYCHQHRDEMLKPDEMRLLDGGFVKYDVFIPGYLSPNAQTNLRLQMEKAISDKDENGYIYVHQVRDTKKSDPKKITYKAGRTVKPKQRAGQWTKQCPSKEKHVVHVHPRSDQHSASMMIANLNPGPPGICSHRLERFVLIELADLVRYRQYLHPQYRDLHPDLKWRDFDQEVKDRKGTPLRPCTDCGVTHREIFEFERIMSGRLIGQELEAVIIPIIDRWANFLWLHARRDD